MFPIIVPVIGGIVLTASKLHKAVNFTVDLGEAPKVEECKAVKAEAPKPEPAPTPAPEKKVPKPSLKVNVFNWMCDKHTPIADNIIASGLDKVDVKSAEFGYLMMYLFDDIVDRMLDKGYESSMRNAVKGNRRMRSSNGTYIDEDNLPIRDTDDMVRYHTLTELNSRPELVALISSLMENDDVIRGDDAILVGKVLRTMLPIKTSDLVSIIFDLCY